MPVVVLVVVVTPRGAAVRVGGGVAVAPSDLGVVAAVVRFPRAPVGPVGLGELLQLVQGAGAPPAAQGLPLQVLGARVPPGTGRNSLPTPCCLHSSVEHRHRLSC